MHKNLKCILFFILVSLFAPCGSFADSPENLLKKKEILIDDYTDINSFLDYSRTTENSDMMPIIFSHQTSKYLKVSHDNIFRVIDSSVELISTKSKKVIWKKDFPDLFAPSILISNDYLIVAGELISDDFNALDISALSKPLSSVRIFDISLEDRILSTAEFLLPGSFKDCISTDDSIILFSDFLSGGDSNPRFPYYVSGDKKVNFALTDLLKMKDSNNFSYINSLKISLKDSPKVSDHKSFLGFGSNLTFTENNVFFRYYNDGFTHISKFNLTEDWLTDNFSISLPGIINSDNSFNVFNGNIQLVTTIFENDSETFNVYFLDESLNLKDSFKKFGTGLIQNIYPLEDKVLVNFSPSYRSTQENWLNFNFNMDGSISTLPLYDFEYSNSFITEDYVFSFEKRDSNKMKFLVRDNNHTLVNSIEVTNKNFIFPSGHRIACDPKTNTIAIPVVLNSSFKSHGMLIFKDYETESPSMYLISDTPDLDSFYSINDTPEYFEFKEDKLYAFSQDSIFIYNLSTNELQEKISLNK